MREIECTSMALMRFGPNGRIFFLMVWCKDGGEVDVEGCGRLSIHYGLLDVGWFCVRKLGGSMAGDECQFCGGGW
jgi:hypothetical protein